MSRSTISRALMRGSALVIACVAFGLGGQPATAATIASGSSHTCAVAVGGSVWCWGYNTYGQLGTSSAVAGTHSLTPLRVEGVEGASAVAAGSGHTCAVLDGGGVRCWGGAQPGILGNGTNMSSPDPVAVLGIDDAIDIDAERGTTCVLRAAGSVWCWGNGVPGTYTSFFGTATPTPTEFLGGATGVDPVTALEVAEHEVCLIGATSGECWTQHSPTGNGAATVAPTAYRISLDEQVLGAAGSSVFGGCSVLRSGRVTCYGGNHVGQLGNGVAEGIESTTRLPRGASFVLGITDGVRVAEEWVSGMQQGYCALTAAGDVYCWGAAPPTYTPTPHPTLRTGLGTTTQLTRGCAVDSAGKARCWDGSVGPLADGPVEVPGLVVATPAPRSVPGEAPGTDLPTYPTYPSPAPPAGLSGGPLDSGQTSRSLMLNTRRVVASAFAVPARKGGRCAPRARIIVSAKGRATSRTWRVRRQTGTCRVNGTVTLRGQLGRADRLTVTVRQPGAPSLRRVLARN